METEEIDLDTNSIQVAARVASESKQVDIIVKQAQEFKVTTEEDFKISAEILKRIKNKIFELTNQRLEITRPLDAAKKKVMDLFAPMLGQGREVGKLETAERIIKDALLAFQREQDKKRREEESIREAEAKKLEAKADKAAEQGKDVKAETFNSQAMAVRTAPLPEKPKVSGISTRRTYYAVVTDFQALPEAYKIANQSMLDKFAQATKGAVPLAGVKFEYEDDISSGRK